MPCARTRQQYARGSLPTNHLLVSLTLEVLLPQVEIRCIVGFKGRIDVIYFEPNPLNLLEEVSQRELRREIRVLIVRDDFRSTLGMGYVTARGGRFVVTQQVGRRGVDGWVVA